MENWCAYTSAFGVINSVTLFIKEALVIQKIMSDIDEISNIMNSGKEAKKDGRINAEAIEFSSYSAIPLKETMSSQQGVNGELWVLLVFILLIIFVNDPVLTNIIAGIILMFGISSLVTYILDSLYLRRRRYMLKVELQKLADSL